MEVMLMSAQKKSKGKKAGLTLLGLITLLVLVVLSVMLVQQVEQMRSRRALDQELDAIAKTSSEAQPTDALPTQLTDQTQSTEDVSVQPGLTPAPEEAQPTQTQTEQTGTTAPQVTAAPEKVSQSINFANLQAENPEIFAWLTVDGTAIDDPVLCHPEDDSFYLTHDPTGKKQSAGSIFMEATYNRMDLSDFNTVLYGHNMRDGSMFAGLHKYKDESFFKKNDTIVLYTPEKKLTYTIFVAYKRDNKRLTHLYDTTGQAGRQAFLEDVYSHSGNFNKDIQVDTNSRILTLSTCIGDSDYRYVVQAVLTQEQSVQ